MTHLEFCKGFSWERKDGKNRLGGKERPFDKWP